MERPHGYARQLRDFLDRLHEVDAMPSRRVRVKSYKPSVFAMMFFWISEVPP
jgi:hypothetical protein